MSVSKALYNKTNGKRRISCLSSDVTAIQRKKTKNIEIRPQIWKICWKTDDPRGPKSQLTGEQPVKLLKHLIPSLLLASRLL